MFTNMPRSTGVGGMLRISSVTTLRLREYPNLCYVALATDDGLTGIGETYFEWKGPTSKGSAAYFRVQGPSVWIEYAPQGDTDHIHTVVRNPKNDYGSALLER